MEEKEETPVEMEARSLGRSQAALSASVAAQSGLAEPPPPPTRETVPLARTPSQAGHAAPLLPPHPFIHNSKTDSCGLCSSVRAAHQWLSDTGSLLGSTWGRRPPPLKEPGPAHSCTRNMDLGPDLFKSGAFHASTVDIFFLLWPRYTHTHTHTHARAHTHTHTHSLLVASGLIARLEHIF